MTKDELLKELKPGDMYAGLILGKLGGKNYHVVLCADEVHDVTWTQANDFAKAIGAELPTRRELLLLYVNLQEEFTQKWYWSSTRNTMHAYCLGFHSAAIDFCTTATILNARAIRRLYI